MERRIPGLPIVLAVGLVLCALVSVANAGGLSTSALGGHPAAVTGLEPAVPLTSATLSISPGTIDQGQGILVQTTPNGGTAPYAYEYFGLPGGCNVDEAQSFQCMPDQTGSFSVYVNVTDANDNQTNSNTVSLKVDPSVQASLSISPGTITQGQNIAITTTASGGSGDYSYQYSGLPGGCQSYTSASFSCTPSSTGNFNVDVNVSDTNGGYVISNGQNVQINPASSGGSGGNGSGGSGGQGGSGGNNSTNPFSGLLKGFSGILSILLIFGIVAFATWILLIVGVWVVAVVLIRRLPKNGAKLSAVSAPLVKCSSCSAAIPGGSKFCPECGASLAPKAS